MKTMFGLPLNLQLFSQDDGAANGGSSATDETKEEVSQTFTAEEVEKQVEAAKAEAKAEYERQLAAKLEESRTEAEKLAKMTAAEKEQFELSKRLAELEKKEQEIAQRELKAETAKTLTDKGLPAEVLELVLADDAEKTIKRVDTFKSIFDKAVQAAVEERLKGKSPQVGSSSPKSANDQVREQFSAGLKGV